MTFLYFAYRSNMLPERLRHRCRSAMLVGAAVANDFSLEFSKPSKDGSGKAHLVARPGAVTPGVVYEITIADLAALDRAEGAGHGYERVSAFPVDCATTGASLATTAYLASQPDTSLQPYDWYLALVIAGARHHQLDPAHLARLQLMPYAIDPDAARDERLEALRVLAAHRVCDYQTLLTS